MVSERTYMLEGLSSCIIQRGIFYRSFDFNKFIERVEETEGRVVGLIFEDNNVELLVEVSPERADQIIRVAGQEKGGESECMEQ